MNEKTISNKVLLEVSNLKKYYPIKRGMFAKIVGHVKAVDDVSFSIKKGETLSLVGESGCGKTTIAKTILKALEPTEGNIFLHVNGEKIDVSNISKKDEKLLRKSAQMVFQNPFTSLNPRMKVRDIIGEPLQVNKIAKGKKLQEEVEKLMETVGLRKEYLIRYPHAFSGGQRQRIVIARALALRPELVVLDEPVAALDVSIRAQILNLLMDLQEQFNLTYLFISHDLSVVEHISDRVAVMYLGKIVELADSKEIFEDPKHPYTEKLLEAVPIPDPKKRAEQLKPLEGEVPDPANPPKGCYFHQRCPYAQDICKKEYPPLKNLGNGENEHLVACHFASQLSLKGLKVY